VIGQVNGMQLGGRPVGPVRLTYGDGTSFVRLRRVDPDPSQFFTPPPPAGRQLQ
jgi:hypothetical protein